MEIIKAIGGLVVFGTLVIGVRLTLDRVFSKAKSKSSCKKDCGCG